MFGDPVDNPKNYLVNSLQELIDMGYITYHLDGNHGGDYPRSEEFVGSGVPYIGANSIVNGEIDFSMAKFLTVERAGKLRKGIAQNDDVLFAHNATVGPTVVLKTTEPKVILSTSLTAYRCNQSKLLPNYLKAYMQSDGFVRQYSGEMKQTTRNQVPITAQKKYLFLVPPIVEQEQFATFVEQTDKSKLAVKQSLEKLETLKKSLMQQYFG
jgi:type I restriction enzyme S subunit